MQSQAKFPKLHSKMTLLPHFTDTVNTTNTLSIQVYYLNIMQDLLNL